MSSRMERIRVLVHLIVCPVVTSIILSRASLVRECLDITVVRGLSTLKLLLLLTVLWLKGRGIGLTFDVRVHAEVMIWGVAVVDRVWVLVLKLHLTLSSFRLLLSPQVL